MDRVFRVQEIQHALLNRDPPFRVIGGQRGNNAVNVHSIIQQLMEQPRKAKPDHQASRINVDVDLLSYAESGVGKVGVFLSGSPLTPHHNYYEMEVLDTGIRNDIAMGLAPKVYPMNRHPGWISDSIGLHTQNGDLYKATGQGRPFGTPCEVGDRLGCGIKFEQVRDDAAFRHVVPVFFTKNGKEIGTVLVPMPASGFYPCIAMRSEGEEVRVITELSWDSHDDVSMCIDNVEDDWARLHDVRLNGQLLEYTGRGKSIADVGLAQAKRPLTTQHHYFELEIVDQGDNCYIAIGVARKNYPRYRHPGWNKGSVAYHADDGKIFIGSGIGDPFGPKCSKGDFMGCGILFPRDYANPANDSDGTRDSDLSDHDENDYVEVESVYTISDSDDDQFFERPQAEEGTKIKVFFTRNGKMVGHREAVMPPGGFYPTVGMLSGDEKVRVDLHPLTG